MNFDFHLVESLPRLAWCAEVTKGDDSINVFHGPWVETHFDSFFEGAWDGDFAVRGFEKATTMVGSGATLTGDGVVFVTPTEPYNRIFSLRLKAKYIVSNSLAFLFTRANDKPDIRYPFYLYDFRRAKQAGCRFKHFAIPTSKKNKIQLHTFVNILISSNGTLTEIDKPVLPPPTDYDSYYSSAKDILGQIIQNAQAPDRQNIYPPLATISTGYDSTASAALASQVGCTEAITFATSGPEQDSGREIAQYIGINTTEYELDRNDYRPEYSVAEFCASIPDPAGIPIAAWEDQLAGKLLLEGNPGDLVWSLRKTVKFDQYFQPSAFVLRPSSNSEFRLRTGYLSFQVPVIGSNHQLAIDKITQSSEMRPWSIGGDYDRPIARRIAEEAGVPRRLFGQKKRASAYVGFSEKHVLREEYKDFESFFLKADIPFLFRIKWRLELSDILTLPIDILYHYLLKLNNKKACKLLVPLLFPLSHRRSTDRIRVSAKLYSFHWGFEKIKHRYDC